MTDTQGDYDLRGPDYETELVGALTARIGDADRFVRFGRFGEPGWFNGFPNFAMYRVAYAGDTHSARDLRLWCEAFGVAYCHSGGMRKPNDAVGVCAGRDAYIFLTTTHWGTTSDELAGALGIAPKTYRRIRKAIAERLIVSLREYWMRLGIAMRQVALAEHRQEAPKPPVALADGNGFDGNWSADGNYRAYPKNCL